jgi:hypothetical protein
MCIWGLKHRYIYQVKVLKAGSQFWAAENAWQGRRAGKYMVTTKSMGTIS